MKTEYIWRSDPEDDYRVHLTGVHASTHARCHCRGTWRASYSNALIDSFKAKEEGSESQTFQSGGRLAVCSGAVLFDPQGGVRYVCFTVYEKG